MKLTLWQRLSGSVTDPPPVTYAHPPFRNVTIADWQKHHQNIVFARELFQDSRFLDMLAVLNNSRPSAALTNCNPTEAAIMLGIRQGYDLLFGTLLRLTEPAPAPQEEVKADYSASDYLSKI